MDNDEDEGQNQNFFLKNKTTRDDKGDDDNDLQDSNQIKEKEESTLMTKRISSSNNTRETMKYSEFYNKGIYDPGKEGRLASRILFLRSFNNWVKSVQINKYCRLLDTNLSVLDLGCGRGGDLNKFFQCKIKLFVGADLSEESLKNAMDRIRKIKSEKYQNNFNCKCLFITEDLSDPNNHLMEKINKAYYFDLVNCQFSMHYHFESEERVRAFLSNVVGRLTNEGYFIGTIIDDSIIVKRLRNRLYPGNKYIKEKLTFGNEYYSIRFYQKRFPKEKGPYGIKYGFFLEDSIDTRSKEGDIKYVDEYLVVFDEFVKLCEEYDLHLVEKFNFTNFYEEYMKIPFYKNLFKKMASDISNPSKVQQWEIIQLYTMFAFRKGKVDDKKKRYTSYMNMNKLFFKDYDPVFIESTFE